MVICPATECVNNYVIYGVVYYEASSENSEYTTKVIGHKCQQQKLGVYYEAKTEDVKVLIFQ